MDVYTHQNSCRDNLTKSFTIPEMFGYEFLTLNEISIVLAYLLIYSIIDNLLYTGMIKQCTHPHPPKIIPYTPPPTQNNALLKLMSH